MNQAWISYLPKSLKRQVECKPHLQNIISNTGWLMADNVLRMGAGLLVTIWVTRYLGPAQFGALSYATAFVMLFSATALLGLDYIVVRNIVRDPSSRDEVLGTAFVLKSIGGVFAVGLTLAAIFLVRPEDTLTRTLVAVVAVGTLFQAFGTFDFWFQSQVQSKYPAYARSFAYLAICVLKVVLILVEAPLVAFAWAALADVALGSIGLAIAYRMNGRRVKGWRATAGMAKTLLRDSWPLMLTDTVVLVYVRIDKIMIGEIVGDAELGIYAVAAMLAEALYFIPAAVTSSAFPGLVEAKSISEELFYERLQRLYNLMALLGYAVAVPTTLLAWWAIPFLFGPSYAEASGMLVGLVWAGVFFNLTMARNYYLTAMNWTRLHFITDLLGCVLNISLNLYLIPRYGGMGAVVASAVSYWFVVHGTCFLFKPLNRTGVMLARALLSPKAW